MGGSIRWDRSRDLQLQEPLSGWDRDSQGLCSYLHGGVWCGKRSRRFRQRFLEQDVDSGLSAAGPPNQIDWLEGPNELDNLPNWYNDPTTANWVASFWSTLADLMHNAGYNPLVGSLVGGQPSPATVFAPLAAAMKSKAYKWGWNYHSYTFGATTSVSTETAYALYYRQVRDQNGLAGIPLVLSEGGYLTTSSTGWQGRLTNDQYLSWLKWFDAQLKQDPRSLA